MSHAEFLDRIRHPDFLWGIRRFFPTVKLVWGWSGLWQAIGESALMLLPGLAAGAYGLWAGKRSLLVWTVLAGIAFHNGRPNLGCLGLGLSLACPLVAAVASWGDPAHVLAGFAPGIAWFFSGAMKGMTMMSLEQRLKQSPETYDRLNAAGELWIP